MLVWAETKALVSAQLLLGFYSSGSMTFFAATTDNTGTVSIRPNHTLLSRDCKMIRINPSASLVSNM